MKKLMLIVLSFHFLNIGISQCLIATLAAEDNLGRKDTVIFGSIYNSIIGIDAILGEENIFDAPYDSLDVRVIQRDSLNFNCLKCCYSGSNASGPNLYFSENIDSKRDFRPFLGSYSSVNTNFEIYIHAVDYPVVVTVEVDCGTGWDQIYLLDSNCDVEDYQGLYNGNASFILPDSSFTTLVGYLDQETNVKGYLEKEPSWYLFPNPVQGEINISGLAGGDMSIGIVDSKGRVIKVQGITNGSINPIDVVSLLPGVYFVWVVGEDGKTISTRKFVKEKEH
ncbi:MAG: T9SS type A sorting domain-containing protein [Lewinellaceae bacterium]|nr:T9SS type A sorting domain-containing protein [Lewinellaceae bacterium]